MYNTKGITLILTLLLSIILGFINIFLVEWHNQNVKPLKSHSSRDTTRSVTLKSISAAIETMKSEINEKIEFYTAEHS